MSDAVQPATPITTIGDVDVYPRSVVTTRDATFLLGRRRAAKVLAIAAAPPVILDRFEGSTETITWDGQPSVAKFCSLTAANAAALRDRLPFLVPRCLGLRQSAGCGDRLGLATPGHVRAIRKSKMAPIFAQQSVRENSRTGRTPQVVLDDAMWGVFQEGWRDGYGADADHLKTPDDLVRCAEAGYTFFTIDPSDHVDNDANTAPPADLRARIDALPWAGLETTWDETRARLCRRIDLGTFAVDASEEALLRATAKYGRVVAHTVAMYRQLESLRPAGSFELEMSVDESATVTSLAEHVYIASELRRLGVKWISLAPRYVGRFEKGVDYIGDVGEFEQSFAAHLAVALTYGPYKLSLHSGSDKFSIFPVAARVAGKNVHLKTAGTSYLEALRTIAPVEPDLFREIVALARERYEADRASYHVSAELAKMPDVRSRPPDALAAVLDDFHAREIIHVTFGSVITNARLRDLMLAAIRRHEEEYYEALDRHFAKHFAAF